MHAKDYINYYYLIILHTHPHLCADSEASEDEEVKIPMTNSHHGDSRHSTVQCSYSEGTGLVFDATSAKVRVASGEHQVRAIKVTRAQRMPGTGYPS